MKPFYSFVLILFSIYQSWSQSTNLELSHIRIFNNSALDTFTFKFDYFVTKGSKLINVKSSLANARLIFDKDTINLDKTNPHISGHFSNFKPGSDRTFQYILSPAERYSKVGNIQIEFSAYLEIFDIEEKLPIFNWKGYSSSALFGGIYIFKGIEKYREAYKNYHEFYLKYTDDHDTLLYNYEDFQSQARENYYQENIKKLRIKGDIFIIAGSFFVSALPLIHFINQITLKKGKNSLSVLILPTLYPYVSSGLTFYTKYNF